jgi:hypothetical protein
MGGDTMNYQHEQFLNDLGCNHCRTCVHVEVQENPEPSEPGGIHYSLLCHHPVTQLRVAHGQFDNLLDHDPKHDCPKERHTHRIDSKVLGREVLVNLDGVEIAPRRVMDAHSQAMDYIIDRLTGG